MRRRLFALLVLGACASPTRVEAPVGEFDAAEFAAAREEVAELTTLADDGNFEELGRSPTSLFAGLVVREPDLVRSVLEDAWRRASRRFGPTQSAVQTVVEFAYAAVDGPRPGRVCLDPFRGWFAARGAVEWRSPRSSASWDPQMRHENPLAVMRSRLLRPPPRTDVEAVWAAHDADASREVDSWCEFVAAAEALGEACATDDAAFKTLLRRAADGPDEFCAVALGASRRPEAVALLIDAARREAPLRRKGSYSTDNPRLRWILRSIAFVSPESLRPIFATLPPTDYSRALAALDGRRAFDILLDDAEALERPAAIRRICACAPGILGAIGGAAPRLFHALLEGVESGDPELRAVALEAAGSRLLSPGDDFHSGPEELLRNVVADLDAGRLEFVPRPPSLWAPRPTGFDWGRRFPTDSKFHPASPPLPFRAEGRRTADGIRLTLVNLGATPLAFDPVGARYGWVEVVPGTYAGREPGGSAVLRLNLGRLRDNVVVPARVLETIGPGASLSWSLPLRPEHRAVAHVDASISDDFDVVGECGAPVVRFGDNEIVP